MRMPNMMLTTLALIIVIAGIGYLSRDDGRIGAGEIGLQLGVPVEHMLTPERATQALPVIVQLVNRTNAAVKLTADGACKIFRFVVTTPDGEFIQAMRQGQTDCTENVTERMLAAGEILEEIRQIPLDTTRYAPGAYMVRVKFWNHQASAPFELTGQP